MRLVYSIGINPDPQWSYEAIGFINRTFIRRPLYSNEFMNLYNISRSNSKEVGYENMTIHEGSREKTFLSFKEDETSG